jgi:hypothetical protein
MRDDHFGGSVRNLFVLAGYACVVDGVSDEDELIVEFLLYCLRQYRRPN